MGMTDKQFNGFLRLIIRALQESLDEVDPNKAKAKLETLLHDLQATLVD